MVEIMQASGIMRFAARVAGHLMGESGDHAASVFSISLIQYEVPNTIASSSKL
jgi:hypothetical protein